MLLQQQPDFFDDFCPEFKVFQDQVGSSSDVTAQLTAHYIKYMMLFEVIECVLMVTN